MVKRLEEGLGPRREVTVVALVMGGIGYARGPSGFKLFKFRRRRFSLTAHGPRRALRQQEGMELCYAESGRDGLF